MKLKQALLHNTGWKMIAMLFTLLNNILIVRILGVETSAVFFYAFAIFILLSTVLKLGLENGIVYFLSKNPEQTKSVTFFLSIVFIIQTIIALIILKYFISETLGFNIFWVVVFIVCNILLYYINAFYQVKKMFISLNICSCAIVILQTVMLTILYVTPVNFLIKFGFANTAKDKIMVISGAAILLQMVLLIIFFYLANKNDFKQPFSNNGLFKKLFSYSFLNFIITVLFFLVLRADFYFVGKYCNKISLSNYLQSAKIGQMLLIFPGLIAGVIFPYTINEPQILAGKVAYLCRFLTFIYLLIYVVFLLTGNFVFTWLLGPDFKLMYEIFAVSFFGIYCLSINLLFISYFEGINKLKIILLSLAVTFMMLIFLNFLFIPGYGYMAAAYVFSMSNFLGLLILFKKFRSTTEILITDILFIKKSDWSKLTFKNTL